MNESLSIRDLSLEFPPGAAGGNADIVLDRISIDVAPGETVALVGESGSGKSLTALAIMGLLPPRARISRGRINFDSRDLLTLGDAERRRLRGARIGMVFQEPMTSLNPVLTIGRQMSEALVEHRRLPKREVASRVLGMIERVGLSGGPALLKQYPHELSGGMRQRVMIAMAMVLQPALLIADEPTTALDVTIQAQILKLLKDLTQTAGSSLLIITHDMGVVAETADRVVVMQRGRVVETDDVDQVFHAPKASYTKALLASVPRIDAPGPPALAPARDGTPPALRLERVSKRYSSGGLFRLRGSTQALAEVSLGVMAGETLAIVGESGSGKSTLGRAAARLIDVDEGCVFVGGEDITRLAGSRLRAARSAIQMIFQDPFATLDPRFPLLATIAEPILVRGLADRDGAAKKAAALMERVGLPSLLEDRLPHELSGGQRQRVAIARALAAEPKIIVADEPTSALDVSVQAQVLELMRELQVERGLAFLFISHDLAVVRQVAHRVAVMRAGRLLEVGLADAVFANPRHAYTRAMLAAVPGIERVGQERPKSAEAFFGCDVSRQAPTPGHWVAP